MSWYSHGARLLDQLTPLLFLEEAVQGRRVLLCGEPASSLAAYVVELGAASVTHLPVDDHRLEIATPSVSAASQSRDDRLPFGDEAFELVLDFDLPSLEDARRDQRVVEIERVLSRDGCALTVLPAGHDLGLAGLIPGGVQPPSLGYGALTTLLRERFPCVEVYFQSLVVGYFFGPVEVKGGEQGVIPHTGLMGDDVDPASAWLFAFGHRVPTLTQLTLVQLPTAGLAEAARVAHLEGASSTEGPVATRGSDPGPGSGSSLAALAETSAEAQAELDDLLDGLDARTRERDELAEELAELERRIALYVDDVASSDGTPVDDLTSRDVPADEGATPARQPVASLATATAQGDRPDNALLTTRLRAPRPQELATHLLATPRRGDDDSTTAGHGGEVEGTEHHPGATQALIEELATLRDAFAARGVELEKLAAGVNRLMAERDALRNKLGSLTPGGTTGVSDSATTPPAEVEVQVRAATAALQGRNAHLTQELERTTDDLRQHETQLHHSTAERDELRARLRAAQSQLEQRSVELGRARDTLLEVTGQRDLLERLVESHERDLERLKEELAVAHAAVWQERQSAEVATRQTETRVAAEARDEVRAQLQARADWQSAVLSEAQSEGTQLRTRLELTSALLEEAQGQLERERARGDLFHAQLDEARTALSLSVSSGARAGEVAGSRPSTSGQGAHALRAELQFGSEAHVERPEGHSITLAEENAALKAQLEEREHRIRRLYQRLSVTSV